jgi:hypothetical protein
MSRRSVHTQLAVAWLGKIKHIAASAARMPGMRSRSHAIVGMRVVLCDGSNIDSQSTIGSTSMNLILILLILLVLFGGGGGYYYGGPMVGGGLGGLLLIVLIIYLVVGRRRI